MNKRIKFLRQTLNVSQDEFGKNIGLTKSGVSALESGTRNVNDKHIRMLELSYNVNPNWLRTGKGEMFNHQNDSLITDLQNKYNLSPAALSIIDSLNKMSKQEQELFLKLATKAFREETITTDTDLYDTQLLAAESSLIDEDTKIFNED